MDYGTAIKDMDDIIKQLTEARAEYVENPTDSNLVLGLEGAGFAIAGLIAELNKGNS